ncbi:BREX-1 system adenine-specific DNA-methyltransferase PglX [Hymenobacter sp. 5414T-23]|uniref:BREX-1 system adenine-specific DNA-methyltransferase PglX n=1 Tax=Hymenobacter sp. 5414T-23 TaxID=2932252 RepID=UPI001FD5A496|nr:BREX-1 system adenine-specific DNA-methyltransferase PglX [Hymenobacter sp. 5414T-23]UOQ83256.1 BREX-1 system adenine-specific DNA-methyltransferase PglX [Hymenobacter sp. 5414T-23]
MDQACGSGHILVYGFELLHRIYEEEGYNPSEIPQLILAHNLYGFEIDERAAQLAAMALMMKARSHQRRFFKKGEVLQPHILCFQDLKLDEKQLTATMASLDVQPSDALRHDLSNMRQATNLGSLILPRADISEISSLLVRVDERQQQSHADLFGQYDLLQIKPALNQLHMLGQKFHCIVDNPPYMDGGNMNTVLADYIRINYPNSKADTMTAFIDRGMSMLKNDGFLGMVNRQSWMFLESYSKLRASVIDSHFIDTLLQIGYNSFPELNSKVVQATAFVIQNSKQQKRKGVYFNLNNVAQSADKKKIFEARLSENNYYLASQNEFKSIPGAPFGYWLSKEVIHCFKSKNIGNEGISSPGIRTGKDQIFIRYWHEVPNNRFLKADNPHGYYNESNKDSLWAPLTRGGEFRKWYGNLWHVVEISKQFKRVKLLCNDYRLRDESYYFKEGITWTMISSSKPSFRVCPKGVLFGNGGPVLFTENINSTMSYLNSSVADQFLKLLNPTLNYTKSDVEKLPIKDIKPSLEISVSDCIEISKNEWDSRETSWDFTENEIIKKGLGLSDVEEAYDLYQQYWHIKFNQLRRLEEEINYTVINSYNLSNELSPDVDLDEVTILKEETKIENGEVKFLPREVISQFVSYAVGCMFGRYSLEATGLIMANQGETVQDYLRMLKKSEQDVSFLPDTDNIIPVLDDEWFEDDIVGRFCDFLKATFGEENFAKNLAFVEECLGKDIRKYFVKDFYADHVQRYKRRPIYWMFSSPQGSFNVLIYMHRYTPTP